MGNLFKRKSLGEISTHLFHYISPREETPVGMTNHTQRLRERYLSFVAARANFINNIRAKSGPYVVGGRGVTFGGYSFVYF